MKYVIFLLALLSFGSCKEDCPPDKKTGTLELADETKAFNPYVGDEHLFFKNGAGDEIELYAPDGLVAGRDNLCYEVTCTEPKFGSPTSCNYYEAESKRLFFTDDNQDIGFDLALFSEVLRQHETLFYDEVMMSFSTENANGQGALVSKIRFSEPYDSTELNIQNWLTFLPEVYDFVEVYVYEGEFLNFFYTKELGLVGFEVDGDTWLLDRIER